MEFQNQPFQDLKERVGWLESRLCVVEEAVEAISAKVFIPTGEAQPKTVSEKQDDERGKPLFKTMEEVQERDEPKG